MIGSLKEDPLSRRVVNIQTNRPEVRKVLPKPKARGVLPSALRPRRLPGGEVHHGHGREDRRLPEAHGPQPTRDGPPLLAAAAHT